MRRTSPYFTLRWTVECKCPQNPFFEQIAAFNHPRVALGYAADCRKSKPSGWLYRVMERKGRGWVEITKETF